MQLPLAGDTMVGVLILNGQMTERKRFKQAIVPAFSSQFRPLKMLFILRIVLHTELELRGRTRLASAVSPLKITHYPPLILSGRPGGGETQRKNYGACQGDFSEKKTDVWHSLDGKNPSLTAMLGLIGEGMYC